MIKKGTCGLCQGGCAVVYTIENGKIVKAEPDKESPKGSYVQEEHWYQIFFMGRSVSNVH